MINLIPQAVLTVRLLYGQIPLVLLSGSREFPVGIHRVFGLDQQTFIGVAFVLINIAVLAFILSRVLYKPVRNLLYDRTERVRGQLKHAEDEKAAASELKTQYEAKLKHIDKERDEILDVARKQATDRAKQLLDEAKAEADTIRERASRDMEMEQERVKDEVRQSIIEVSSLMAQRFVARTMDNETRERLFAEVMDELNGADFAGSGRAV
jgi:F-type H+-transporting ATPase subunit b